VLQDIIPLQLELPTYQLAPFVHLASFATLRGMLQCLVLQEFFARQVPYLHLVAQEVIFVPLQLQKYYVLLEPTVLQAQLSTTLVYQEATAATLLCKLFVQQDDIALKGL
jgi:hypothetical protein